MNEIIPVSDNMMFIYQILLAFIDDENWCLNNHPTQKRVVDKDPPEASLVLIDPVEILQVICSYLPLKDKLKLAVTSKYFHNQVVFGPGAEVFAWRDGINDVKTPPKWMLFDAVWRGASVHVINVLLNAKADLHQLNENGWPVLVCAAFKGQYSTVSALLAAGADVDARVQNNYNEDFTALMIGGKYLQVINVLLEAGADVNAVNSNGETALNIACRSGYADTVSRLLAAHADVNLRNIWGFSVLGYSHMLNHGNITRILLAHGAIE